jgi:hypothetical protein
MGVEPVWPCGDGRGEDFGNSGAWVVLGVTA